MTTELILLGLLTVTSYRATPAQTRPGCKNNHECTTSIGENVSGLGVAVSPDMLASGRVHYRDCLYLPGIGYRIVDDTTNQRLHNTVDVFVYDKAAEKKFGVKHLRVWLIPSPKTEIADKGK
jgi:3D (Asp-Asp-Asp) domain-containing protein